MARTGLSLHHGAGLGLRRRVEGILARGGTSGGDVRVLGETVRYAFVCDPDGNHIEISQRASLTGGRL
jgi:lactoylglutathione lyase